MARVLAVGLYFSLLAYSTGKQRRISASYYEANKTLR